MPYQAGGVDFELSQAGVFVITVLIVFVVFVLATSNQPETSDTTQQRDQLGDGPEVR